MHKATMVITDLVDENNQLIGKMITDYVQVEGIDGYRRITAIPSPYKEELLTTGQTILSDSVVNELKQFSRNRRLQRLPWHKRLMIKAYDMLGIEVKV